MLTVRLIPDWVYWAAIAALAATSGMQQVRISGTQAELAQEKHERSLEALEQTNTVLRHEQKVKSILATHTAAQREKDDDYVKQLDTVRANYVRSADDARRLRSRLEAFTGSGRQPGETESAACERAQHRLPIVGGLLAEGIELEAESRAIIEQRDAEVKRLLEQIKIDRAALQ